MEHNMIYFKRKMYDTMLKWKTERNGDTALLIQGARRIGKSTIAEESEKHKISPIEVKSSGYKTHKSLDEFCCKFSDRIQNKYLIYTKDLKRENGINYIPVYMTMFL